MWRPFDQFLADNTGVPFIDPSDSHRLDVNRWNVASIGGESNLNEGLFFIGANAMAANGGDPVPLFSPSVYREGSSGVHLRPNEPDVTDATHIMVPQVRDGAIARQLHPVTIAMLKDIGVNYVVDVTPPEVTLTASVESRTNQREFAIGVSYDPTATGDFFPVFEGAETVGRRMCWCWILQP